MESRALLRGAVAGVLLVAGGLALKSSSRGEAPADSASALANDLRVAEYQTMRQEISQSLSAQQHIIQWSLASFAAFFVAGLVLLGQNDVSVTSGTTGTLFLMLFGLALPGVAVASCWSWLGELIRMERAGRYLRGYEQEIAKWCHAQGVIEPPLRWETLNASGRSLGVGRGKQQIGYFGSLLLYMGALGVSEIIFVISVGAHSWHPDTLAYIEPLLYLGAAATLLLQLVAVLSSVRHLRAIAREAAPLGTVNPAAQVYPLPAP